MYRLSNYLAKSQLKTKWKINNTAKNLNQVKKVHKLKVKTNLIHAFMKHKTKRT